MSLYPKIKNIFVENYILPSIENRLNKHLPAIKIQRWWRKQIKGYFEVSIFCYFDFTYGLTYYAYDYGKNIYVVSFKNDQLNPIYTPINGDIYSTWLNIYKDFIKEKSNMYFEEYNDKTTEELRDIEEFMYIKIDIFFGLKMGKVTLSSVDDIITDEYYEFGYGEITDQDKLIGEVKMPHYDNIFVEKFNKKFLEHYKKI
jgi:hypothetical protein